MYPRTRAAVRAAALAGAVALVATGCAGRPGVDRAPATALTTANTATTVRPTVAAVSPPAQPGFDYADPGEVCRRFTAALYSADTNRDTGPGDAYIRAAAYMRGALAGQSEAAARDGRWTTWTRAEKGDDNMLNITHEGRAAALDLRFVGLSSDQPQKIHVAADKIAAIWRENADRIYLGLDGGAHPTPGALQLVFCDMGTPGKGKEWVVYEELRHQLVARGMPARKIRFIHEAKDDRQKGELFQAARDGRIAVLIGSTEKMGAGTNVQDRAVALHHLDPQWRPRDIEQREGRIDRQGNQNPEVRILRYVTERSFDAYMWQTLERKSRFINQVMGGRYDGREAEDLGDGSMSYEEVKAAATGNPLLVDHAAAKADLSRLERLERGYYRNLDQLCGGPSAAAAVRSASPRR